MPVDAALVISLSLIGFLVSINCPHCTSLSLHTRFFFSPSRSCKVFYSIIDTIWHFVYFFHCAYSVLRFLSLSCHHYIHP